MVAEEFAFLSKNCWHDIMIPLLSLYECALIAITTVSPNPENHVTDLIERNVFPVMAILLVCPDCRAAGVAEKCVHRAHFIPHWQSEERRELTKLCYGPENTDKFARESQGFLKQPSLACFNHEHINRTFTNPRFILEGAAEDLVFMVIDPCSGSKKPETGTSEFAWLTFIGPGFRVLGGDSIPTLNPLSWEGPLIDHLIQVMRRPEFVKARLIVFIEGNMPTEAYTAQQLILRTFPDARFPGNLGEKVGVITTPQSKHNMSVAFQLALAKNNISFFRDFITSDEFPNRTLQKIKQQLINYTRCVKPGKDVFSDTRFTFSGKGSGNKKDDFAIVMQLGLYCLELLYTNPEWMHHQLRTVSLRASTR